MLSLWDFFANHPVLLVITSILFFVLFYFLLFRLILGRLFPQKKFPKKINMLILFIVIPAVLTIPVFGTWGSNYGYATKSPGFLAHDDTYFYLKSSVQKTGRSTYTNNRLHKIDIKTGKEIKRYKLERNLEKYNSGLIGEIFWVELPEGKELKGINIVNGEKQIIDEAFLNKFNNTSTNAIQTFTTDFHSSSIHIYINDGTDTLVNPFVSGNDHLTQYPGAENNVTPDLILKGASRKHLEYGGKPVLKNNTWINGEIIYDNPQLKQFIISSYRTTDNTNASLECYSYDLVKRWHISTPLLPEGTIGDRWIIDHSIIFCIDNSLVSVDLITGKLNWRNEI